MGLWVLLPVRDVDAQASAPRAVLGERVRVSTVGVRDLTLIGVLEHADADSVRLRLDDSTRIMVTTRLIEQLEGSQGRVSRKWMVEHAERAGSTVAGIVGLGSVVVLLSRDDLQSRRDGVVLLLVLPLISAAAGAVTATGAEFMPPPERWFPCRLPDVAATGPSPSGLSCGNAERLALLQRRLVPGARTRVRLASRGASLWTGVVDAVGDSLQVRGDDGVVRAMAWPEIGHAWVSGGRTSRLRRAFAPWLDRERWTEIRLPPF